MNMSHNEKYCRIDSFSKTKLIQQPVVVPLEGGGSQVKN
jgi:hypothetical protein